MSVCLSVMTKPRTIDLRLSAWTPTTQECYNSLMEFCADGLISDLLKLTHSGRTSRPECSAIMQGRYTPYCFTMHTIAVLKAMCCCNCMHVLQAEKRAVQCDFHRWAALGGSWLLNLHSSLLSRKLAAAIVTRAILTSTKPSYRTGFMYGCFLGLEQVEQYMSSCPLKKCTAAPSAN